MNPLERLVRTRVAEGGPMSVRDYMALALGHPEHGYYTTHDAIGATGDFVTAPEISQMFGEIVGAWLAHAWRLGGSPLPAHLVELGPGRGTLIADVLRTLRLVPELAESVEIHLVETSPRLRAQQRARLDAAGVHATWHDTLADVPDGATLLVANEFFDALPIRQLVRIADGWAERCVGVDQEGGLAFVAGPPVAETEVPPELRASAEGTVVELAPAAAAIAAEIGGRLMRHPGAALIVDYGYAGPAAGDTLQALRGRRYADPLQHTGEADLTAHVDFAALMGAASSSGAAVHGPTTQGTFLTALGIAARAEALRAGGASAADLSLAVERLTGFGGMGTLFKVLALTSPGLAPPPFDMRGA